MAPSPTIRRLLKETAELSSAASCPNPAFHAAPVSDSDLHEWHFTLLGPPAPSPYAGGLYHGRISFPSTYPLKPPNFRFLTPSGRFETNREICLSISGFHEETWMPAWGVRLALTALRTFMAEKGTAGQVGGLEASHEVRERLAKESRARRCEGCGSQGRTNEEVMNEWWAVCREKGVKVGDDGEEVGLELLPEGMQLEARDPNQPKEDVRTEMSPPSPKKPQSARREDSEAVQVDADVASMFSMDPPNASSTQQGGASTAFNSPSDADTSEPRLAIPTTTGTVQLMTADAGNTTTIDTAIGALVLALCLMILKKIFYPASTALDEYYLPDG